MSIAKRFFKPTAYSCHRAGDIVTTLLAGCNRALQWEYHGVRHDIPTVKPKNGGGLGTRLAP